MVVRTLDMKKYPFRPRENDEELLSHKESHFNVIGLLMYLVNYTRPDTSFDVNLLSIYSFSPTQIH